MTKSARWAWIVALVATTGTTMVLGFLLAVATNNRTFYEQHYTWLFWVNVVVASLLALVIFLLAVRMWFRVLRGKFGSRLLLKLAAIFALVGALPGLIIYTVSYQFVSRSIESWFDVKVEKALDAGLTLGQNALDVMVSQLAAQTRQAAQNLSETGMPVRPLTLERLRVQLAADDIAILSNTGQVQLMLAQGDKSFRLEKPAAHLQTMIRAARNSMVTSQVDGLDDDAHGTASVSTAPSSAKAKIRVLAYLPSTSFDLIKQDRFLYVSQAIPSQLVVNALAVQTAYREYQQRSLARTGLRTMYIGTLTLALILAVFGALLIAITLANQLARPLLLLAEGMRQVALGDLSAKAVFGTRDELGGLTRSFAEMTQQLSEARSLAQNSVEQVERARTNLQTILDNLTAGVIVFDKERRIDTVNPGATRIVRLPLSVYKGQHLQDIPQLKEFAESVWQRFDLYASNPEKGERNQWQDSFELIWPQGAGVERENQTLLMRGANLPQGAKLLVFDDISEIVSAQRSVAWSEVARRLAHEIKNPLTPIQLSAERLQHKLEHKLDGADQSMLVRCVSTIVNQVQAMKQLVNEFRDYSRLPAAQLKPLDLNELVMEVLNLYATDQEWGRLNSQLALHLPLIEGDMTQLRQVIHNLVQNSLDAIQEQPQGRVDLVTEAVCNEQGMIRAVRLQVLDNGPGFSDKVLKRAFEPYVTTKAKGTGLGLAVVKKIADEHHAKIRIANRLIENNDETSLERVIGAQVSLSFSKLIMPLHSVPSRQDITGGNSSVTPSV
jgi:nitrogen fixation/metabolism regulation signal transduction histidine kinase